MATKTLKLTIPPPEITESSGNVFADLGLPNPEQELMNLKRAVDRTDSSETIETRVDVSRASLTHWVAPLFF